MLISERPAEPVLELHAETPPFGSARAYVTVSWTDESWNPTLITAAERPVLHVDEAFLGVGAGLLWLDANDYSPNPMLVRLSPTHARIEQTKRIPIGESFKFFSMKCAVNLSPNITSEVQMKRALP